MYGWMGGWMGVLMGRVMDDEMWALGWCGGWGLIVYHLRVPQHIHWKKMHMGDSLTSNLLSCLLEGRKEGGF